MAVDLEHLSSYLERHRLVPADLLALAEEVLLPAWRDRLSKDAVMTRISARVLLLLSSLGASSAGVAYEGLRMACIGD